MHRRCLAALAAATLSLCISPVALGFSAWSTGAANKPASPRTKAHPRKGPKSGKPRRAARTATKPARAKRPGARRANPVKTHRVTPSFYVRTLSGRRMWRRGCRTARERSSGIVILAFGRLYERRGTYGTQTFSGTFAANRAITRSMQTFARAYVRCRPRGSRARIVLARGTSNYSPAVPHAYRAGFRWARETVAFARFLKRVGWRRWVRAAAAIDAEPAWNPGFRRTREFFRGYAARRPGIKLYNFGSLDGGVGSIWTARQVWYVSSGMRYARMIPEVYFPGMAEQWAEMSRIAVSRYGRPVRFAGVMTQKQAVPGCRCGYWPHQAHRRLVRALNAHPKTRVGRLPLTNISWE